MIREKNLPSVSSRFGERPGRAGAGSRAGCELLGPLGLRSRV